MQWLYLVVFKS